MALPSGRVRASCPLRVVVAMQELSQQALAVG
jgi:hypothetical protein